MTLGAVVEDDVGDEPGVAAVVAGDDDGLHDVGMAVEHRLDLAELDAVTADLDLVVGAAGELDVAGRVDPHDVAGGVHAAHAGAVDEALGGQLGPVVVAAGDALAADVQLAERAEREPAAGGVEHEDRRVGDRRADRDRRVRRRSASSWVSDQIVVSVGPYMFVKRPGSSARSSAASAAGSASPPSIRWRIVPSAARSAGSATSIAASDGVHCRWVTPWRATSAATASSAASTGSARPRLGTVDARRASTVRLGLEQQVERGEHVVGGDAEVDEAGDLVDAGRRHRLDDRGGVVGRAEQPARAEVAVGGHLEQLVELLGATAT